MKTRIANAAAKSTKATISLWGYAREYKAVLFLVLFLATINQVFSLLDPLIFRFIVDNYALKITQIPRDVFVSGVLLLIGAIVLVAFISRLAKTFQDYYVNFISQKVSTSIYGRGVAHTLSLPYEVFEDRRSGEVLQRLQKARTDIQVFITSLINILFISIIGVLFVIIYAFTVHPWLGFGFLITIPILAFTAYIVSAAIKKAQRGIVEQSSALAGSTTETLRNVELVKSLGLEQQEINRLNAGNEKILELELKKIKIMRKLSFIQGTVINALRMGLLFLMLYLLMQGEISLGSLMSLFFYSFFVFGPLGQLGQVASDYQQSMASIDSLNELLSTPVQKRPKNAKRVGKLASIDFKDVTLQYSSAKKPALKNVSLRIHKGQTVALAGSSGSGKSTLIKLLLGLYEPSSGEILINNIDTKKIDHDDLRHRIGFVTQETQLFAGTIRENLLFASPKSSDKDCINALRMAAINHIIERTGDGLDTRIGEGGIKLSGGERQRVAIARALLRKPELLIFDEATSSLDSLSEQEISKTIDAIRKKQPNLMIILIAHRLSTITRADHIFVFEHGQLSESGSHEVLLKKKGLYYAFWRQQRGEDEDDA